MEQETWDEMCNAAREFFDRCYTSFAENNVADSFDENEARLAFAYTFNETFGKAL